MDEQNFEPLAYRQQDDYPSYGDEAMHGSSNPAKSAQNRIDSSHYFSTNGSDSSHSDYSGMSYSWEEQNPPLYESFAVNTDTSYGDMNYSIRSLTPDGFGVDRFDDVGQSSSSAADGSNQSDTLSPTPSSLGWEQSSHIWESYDFVVIRNEPPYFRLKSNYMPTSEMPAKVYLETPNLSASINKTEKYHACVHPACAETKGSPRKFTRPADLERHYTYVHNANGGCRKYPCEYQRCSRSTMPFSRKEHYRDHLRDYHKEDIGSRKTNEKKTDAGVFGSSNEMGGYAES